MNKRGLSSVVATITIVLITLVAAGIVAGVIVSLVKDKLDSTECFDYKAHFEFKDDLGYNCYGIQGANKLYLFSIGANPMDSEKEGEILGFRVSLAKDNGEAVVFDIYQGSTINRAGEFVSHINISKNVYEVPKSGEIKTYIFNSTSDVGKISIASKLRDGKICEISDEFNIGEILCESERKLTYE